MSRMLTEEQVRKAIRKHAHDDSCYIFEVYGEMCGLIADELNAALGGDDKSRWHELFGTPERAVKTLHELCGGCCGLPEEVRGDHDTLLEWLEGDA